MYLPEIKYSIYAYFKTHNYICALRNNTQNNLNNETIMIAALARMAGSLSPAMYRYIRMYIRFLLPRKDQPLEQMIRQLRFVAPEKHEKLEKQFLLRYRPRKYKYYCDRLWWLLEEVRLDPLQPWNQKAFKVSDFAVQRKILGGMCLAANGLNEPASLRFREAHKDAGNGEGLSPAVKLQTSWFSGTDSLNPNQVNEQVGVLMGEYLSAVRVKSFLHQVIRECLHQGCLPEGEPEWDDNQELPEIRLAVSIIQLMKAASAGRVDEVQYSLPECCQLAETLQTNDDYLESLIQARTALWLVNSPKYFFLAQPMLDIASRHLPPSHFLYKKIIRYKIQILLLQGKLNEAEKQIHHYSGLVEFSDPKDELLPVLRAMLYFLRNDPGKTLQYLITLPVEFYSDPGVRLLEIYVFFDLNSLPTVGCRLESFRKLLARKGERESRNQLIKRLLVRLDSGMGDFKHVYKSYQDFFLELRDLYPWSPGTGELFPFEAWFNARLHGKSILKSAQTWQDTL